MDVVERLEQIKTAILQVFNSRPVASMKYPVQFFSCNIVFNFQFFRLTRIAIYVSRKILDMMTMISYFQFK